MTLWMLTANPELSNTFLHKGQAFDFQEKVSAAEWLAPAMSLENIGD
jgi:hypothetical protein